jgi:hypothetical protein
MFLFRIFGSIVCFEMDRRILLFYIEIVETQEMKSIAADILMHTPAASPSACCTCHHH